MYACGHPYMCRNKLKKYFVKWARMKKGIQLNNTKINKKEKTKWSIVIPVSDM